MKKINKQILILFCFGLVILLVDRKTNQPKRISLTEARSEYEQFLFQHPYNNRPHLSNSEWKKLLPKKDRPDLAMEQDFLMTMDPALKDVPRERLIEAYKAAELSRQSSSRQVDWTEHGPDNVGGRTRAVMFDPNDPDHNTVWTGGVAGGLWVAEDITGTGVSLNDFIMNVTILNANDFFKHIAEAKSFLLFGAGTIGRIIAYQLKKDKL